jgi:hypothetical protein
MPVGVGVPCVVRQGVVLDGRQPRRGLIGVDVGAAAVAAIAQGARRRSSTTPTRPGLPRCASAPGAACRGTVMVLTLGTGIGSAPFIDGRLVPNTEFGHLEVARRRAELQRASARVRTELLGLAGVGERVTCVPRCHRPAVLAGDDHPRWRGQSGFRVRRAAALARRPARASGPRPASVGAAIIGACTAAEHEPPPASCPTWARRSSR